MTATTAASASIAHPRISERRAAVDEARLATLGRRLTIAGLIVLAVLLAAGSTQTSLLDVDEIRVIGTARNSPDVIRQLSTLELGEPLLGLDLARAEQNLAGLADIAAVRVDKRWDGVVTITVTERVPVARVPGEETTMVVASDGVVVELANADAAAQSGLPLITGAMFTAVPGESVPSVVTDALTVAAVLPPDLVTLVERVEISVDMLSLRLSGGGRVQLGDARDLDAKFDAMRAFFAQVDLACLDVVNVQAPTVPVLSRDGSCAP